VGKVALFLSPHLDDVVLSCPAYIQRLVKEGIEVRIVTVFTEADPGSAALYRARRAEDRKAVRELGASATHLGFPDAPYRSPRYRDFCGIVFGRAREYPGTRRLVADKIGELIARWRPLQVVSPLAVGNHVDHRLVRDAALLAVKPEEWLFYEDRPYAFVREQVDHVLGRSMARPERFWRRYFADTYVRNYRGTTSDRRIIKHWAAVPPFPSKIHKAFTVETGPVELARTLAALRAYGTQMPDLFTDEAERETLYGTVAETIYALVGRAIQPADRLSSRSSRLKSGLQAGLPAPKR
jgi:LmbE family N-acetylglucosaminyl deacetylase